jgi:D-cysteine desulfhydrase
VSAISSILERFPREALFEKPTPVQRLRQLERAVGGGVALYVKRDDAICPMGSSKLRYLEFVLGAFRAKGSDCLVHCGGPTSNYLAQLAMVGAQRGIAVHLAIQRDEDRLQGNALLASLYGATLRQIGGSACDAAKKAWARELTDAGHRPFVIEPPFSNHSAILGFLAAFLELQAQVAAGVCPMPTHVVMCSAGNSYLGLRLGAALAHAGVTILAFSPIRFSDTALTALAGDRREFLQRKLVAFGEAVGVSLPTVDPFVSEDDVGPGYPTPSEPSVQAVRELARTEGILLDPVYTGKAMAGCLRMIRGGALPPESRILFWHSGGAPNVFRYGDTLAAQRFH